MSVPVKLLRTGEAVIFPEIQKRRRHLRKIQKVDHGEKAGQQDQQPLKNSTQPIQEGEGQPNQECQSKKSF